LNNTYGYDFNKWFSDRFRKREKLLNVKNYLKIKKTKEMIYTPSQLKSLENNQEKYKHLLQRMQNTFKQRIQYLKQQNVKIPDIDYMNSVVFSFSGGLADNVLMLLDAGNIIKNLDKNVKIYFNVEYLGRYDSFILEKYNISKYFNYEFIALPAEVLKAYNDSGLYIYSYKNYKLDLMRDKVKLNKLSQPFIRKYMSNFDELVNYPDMMNLIIPLDETNTKKLSQIKNAENSVCIHIRMGDELRPNSTYLPKISYFKNSIKEMAKKISKNNNKTNITFFMFSNTMRLVKVRLNNATLRETTKGISDNITFDYVDINDDSSPEFDLELMRNCQHFIISQGGFSKLIVALGQYKNKMVISPPLPPTKYDKEKEWGYEWTGNWKNIKILEY
jgi:hypothetical protein